MHNGPKIELSVFSCLGARVSQWVKGDFRGVPGGKGGVLGDPGGQRGRPLGPRGFKG